MQVNAGPIAFAKAFLGDAGEHSAGPKTEEQKRSLKSALKFFLLSCEDALKVKREASFCLLTQILLIVCVFICFEGS